MKFKFKTQPYQQEAVGNIAKVFKGQPRLDMVRYTRDLGIKKKTDDLKQASIFDAYEENDDGFENAKILLDESEILENIRHIQQDCNYKESEELVSGLGKCSLDVEMETGTGKTYVYINTIFELNERYGWSKFIVVVPSIAIREGVKKSFSMMEEHFMDKYHKKARYFVYNSKRLSELDSFASSSDINVMIINTQAFNARGADARRIDMALDEFQSRKPIDVVAKTRPILILDEPQKMGDEKSATQVSLKKFNPLFCVNFSATHKKQHNLVYCLDAVDAYNKCLVKKIQVKGFEIKNLRGTDKYLYLQDIVLSPNKPPMCKLEFEINHKIGIKRESRILKVGDDLYELSAFKGSEKLEQYKGYKIADIDPLNDKVTFLNGEELDIEGVSGDVLERDIRRIQIRETILSHIEQEEKLFQKGIKCLSLFFIDEVVKYRDYSKIDEKGEYARIFEDEYKNIINEKINSFSKAYATYLKSIDVKHTHKGYFSIDKKSGKVIDSKDNKEVGSDDISAYDLILKNKEKLLSFDEPTRFIFSHSALREGWDNPNIFQICVLKHGGDNPIAKRQEVGRGLRIAVDKFGNRADMQFFEEDKMLFHNVNTLTIIATDSYKNFVNSIQIALKENLADRPTKANIEYFKGKFIVNQYGQRLQINSDNASLIYKYLIRNSYIDDDDKITKKYNEDKANNALAILPDKLKMFADSITRLIDCIYDENVLKEMLGKGKKSNIEKNPLNKNFKNPAFDELWEKINHKYTYRVEFDSEELIVNSIKSINNGLYVSEQKCVLTIGSQKDELIEDELNRGESFSAYGSKTETINSEVFGGVKYDLIGKISNGTKLTRRTVVRVLQGITKEKFGLFEKNPEEFITRVSKLINEQKANTIVNYITYNKTNQTYDTNIFTLGQSKIDYKKAFRVQRAIQDYVVTDGFAEDSKEKQFASALDGANEVCVYAKLPRAFQIPTPVGNYTPDWAIAFKEGAVKHIYFVAETKGSMESLELRGVEKAKIDCARKLYNKLKQADNVRYEVVDDYQKLLDVIKSID